MFKLETDILRKAVYMAVSEVYKGDDDLLGTNLRLTATEMIAEIGRAYVVMTKRYQCAHYNVYGYFSDVDLAVDGAHDKLVVEISKLSYGYKVQDISGLFG